MALKIGDIIAEIKADVTDFKKGISEAQGHVDDFMKKAEKGSKMFAAGIGIATGAVVAFGVASVKAFSEAQAVDAQLNQVLKSTGKEANITADEISNLATEIENYSGLSDEAIKSGQTLLLQFDGINKETLPQASKLMADLAIRMGKDVNSAAQTLGLALTEPDTALRRLRMSGVIFNDEQIKTIKNLVDTGKLAEAQAMIFKGLEENVGGAAEAYGKTLAGQIDIAKQNVDDFQEALGQTISGPLTQIVTAFNNWFQAMGGPEGIMKRFNEEILPKFQEWAPVVIGFIVGGLVPAFYALAAGIWAALAPLLPFLAIGAAIGLAVKLLIDHFGGWNAMIQALQAEVAKLQPYIDILLNVFNTIMLPVLKDIWFQIQTGLIPALKMLWAEIGPILIPVLKFLGAVVVGVVIAAIQGFIVILDALIRVLTVVVVFISNWVRDVKKFFTDLYMFLVGGSLIPDLINGIFEWFKKLPTMITDALKGLYKAITEPFVKAFDKVKEMAGEVIEKLKKISPFNKDSPSLVELVDAGVAKIKDAYASLTDISVPAVSAQFGAGVAVASNNTRSVTQNIQVYPSDSLDVSVIVDRLSYMYRSAI